MRVICMSFDGTFKTERPIFTEVADALEYASDLGSKWYFYPWHFIVSDSTKTIVHSPHGMAAWDGKRTATVVKAFNALYTKMKEAKEEAGVDKYHFMLINQLPQDAK